MRRFWLDRSCLKGEEFVLKGPSYHHIHTVSKIKKGEAFEVFIEGLQKYTVFLSSVSRCQARAKILSIEPVPPLPKPYIHLAISIPKLSKIDFIIEKSVELGVKEIHPFVSEFSFISKPSAFLDSKQKRWQKIIESSLALSGRTEPLTFHPPCFLKELEIPQDHLAIMAYIQNRDQSLKSVLNSQKKIPKDIWLFIGSEGGFTEEEAIYFKSQGGYLFSLGEQILRVETACLLGLGILKYHYHS